MASPKASGRMINRSISESKKIASLSPIAAVLYMMLIPHFNAHGKMSAGPGVIKDEVVPEISYLSYENLPEYLQEISDKTEVKWFRVNSKWWLHSLNFKSKHQHLDPKKMGPDNLPSYQNTESGSSPGVVEESPSRAEGLKVEGLREEETLKPKDSSSSPLEKLATEMEQPAESTATRMMTPDIRFLHVSAFGIQFPPGAADVAVEICERFSADAIREAFKTAAVHNKPNMAYVRGILYGGKGVSNEKQKARGQPNARTAERSRILEANAKACRDFCAEE